MPENTSVNELLQALPGSEKEYPFGPHVAVYKLGGKIFALVPTDEEPPSISLKCDPEYADGLRNIYDAIIPGYHLNKRHWNTITLNGTVPEGPGTRSRPPFLRSHHGVIAKSLANPV